MFSFSRGPPDDCRNESNNDTVLLCLGPVKAISLGKVIADQTACHNPDSCRHAQALPRVLFGRGFSESIGSPLDGPRNSWKLMESHDSQGSSGIADPEF